MLVDFANRVDKDKLAELSHKFQSSKRSVPTRWGLLGGSRELTAVVKRADSCTRVPSLPFTPLPRVLPHHHSLPPTGRTLLPLTSPSPAMWS